MVDVALGKTWALYIYPCAMKSCILVNSWLIVYLGSRSLFLVHFPRTAVGVHEGLVLMSRMMLAYCRVS